jgi:periplasmic copper chaperone A
MKTKLILLGLALLFVTSACGSVSVPSAVTGPSAAPNGATGELQIKNAWARAAGMSMGDSANPSTPGSSGGMGNTAQANGAVYMTIVNGNTADRLVTAKTGAAQAAELHTVEMNGGMMQMHPVEGGIPVPANGQVELKPGGYHVMLIGLKQELKPGMTINLELTFEKAGVKQVVADVRSTQQ